LSKSTGSVYQWLSTCWNNLACPINQLSSFTVSWAAAEHFLFYRKTKQGDYFQVAILYSTLSENIPERTSAKTVSKTMEKMDEWGMEVAGCSIVLASKVLWWNVSPYITSHFTLSCPIYWPEENMVFCSKLQMNTNTHICTHLLHTHALHTHKHMAKKGSRAPQFLLSLHRNIIFLHTNVSW